MGLTRYGKWAKIVAAEAERFSSMDPTLPTMQQCPLSKMSIMVAKSGDNWKNVYADITGWKFISVFVMRIK